jgi:RNA polymerase sigma-70 factor (ECF subfamily)
MNATGPNTERGNLPYRAHPPGHRKAGGPRGRSRCRPRQAAVGRPAVVVLGAACRPAAQPRKAQPVMADPDGLDDAALVVALRGGDEAALAAIYQRYGGAVWAIAQRVCRDPYIAEDVSQRVFTALWSQPERYDPRRGSLRTWLVTHARARAVDAVRSEAARRRREDRDARLAPTTTAADEVEAAVDRAGRHTGVHRALAKLPEPQRQAISLTYFDGHTFRESARLIGAPEGTVKSRIRLGLDALRRALTAEGMAP